MESEDPYRRMKRKIIVPFVIYLVFVFISTIAFLLVLFSPIFENLESTMLIIMIVSFFLICILPAIPLSKYIVKINKQIIAEREKDESEIRTYDI